MGALSCGERVVRCLTGEQIDRVPYGVGIGWVPWGGALAHWQRDAGDPELDVMHYFGFDLSFTNPKIHAGIFPEFTWEVLEEKDGYITLRDNRGIVTRNLQDHSSMPEFLDYPVKTPADWERLKTDRLQPLTPGRIAEDWDAFRARLKDTGEAVQVGSFPYGLFGTPRDLLGAEELLLAFYTEPEMLHDIMGNLTTLWLSLWEQVAAEVRIDHIHIWEDMSGKQGSLISPRMVEEFMMPCYDRIVDFARAHGVRVISVDTDGDCSELVPLMMRHGINTFFPFEVQAGNDLRVYRRSYPTLGILGGLDKRALAGTQADVDAQLAMAEEMVRQGRYVPGFDHLIPPDACWEHYKYAAERMREICYGSARQ